MAARKRDRDAGAARGVVEARRLMTVMGVDAEIGQRSIGRDAQVDDGRTVAAKVPGRRTPSHPTQDRLEGRAQLSCLFCRHARSFRAASLEAGERTRVGGRCDRRRRRGCGRRRGHGCRLASLGSRFVGGRRALHAPFDLAGRGEHDESECGGARDANEVGIKHGRLRRSYLRSWPASGRFRCGCRPTTPPTEPGSCEGHGQRARETDRRRRNEGVIRCELTVLEPCRPLVFPSSSR